MEQQEQKFKDQLEQQQQQEEQAFNQREDTQYTSQLQEMWDDPDQRGDLTGNEIQRLKDTGYIKGGDDVATTGGGGAVPVPAASIDTSQFTYTTDAAADADTQSKLDAGVDIDSLSQVDFERIANMKLEEQMEAQRKLNPNATLAGVLNFGQLTGTSPIMHMTEQNFTEMAQTGVGYDELSMEMS